MRERLLLTLREAAFGDSSNLRPNSFANNLNHRFSSTSSSSTSNSVLPGSWVLLKDCHLDLPLIKTVIELFCEELRDSAIDDEETLTMAQDLLFSQIEFEKASSGGLKVEIDSVSGTQNYPEFNSKFLKL